MIINIKPRRDSQEITQAARKLLSDGIDTGDDEVLDTAIKIAYDEKIPLHFRRKDTLIPVDVAYRIRYNMALSLR